MSRDKHYTDDEMMYSFKVQLCPRLDHHNWKHCPHRHPGEVAAQRRHPSLHKPAFCMNLKLYGSCAAGDDCPFSHNTFEMSLHPERYKTTLCTLGDKCNREICFFAHSTEDLRTPDVTAPLGAMGQEATITLIHLTNGDIAGSEAAAAAAAGESMLTGPDGLPLLQQQDGLQNLLRQVEQQLQLDRPAQQQQQTHAQQQQQTHAQLQQAHMQAVQQQRQQQLMQQDQLMLAQAQQQQRNELVLAQQQLMMANGVAGSNQGVGVGLTGQTMVVPAGYATAGPLQQRGGVVGGMQQQQQLVPMLMQDSAAAHRGESFTSQCSTSSYISGMGALRAMSGALPVSPLIERSAHSFTVTDASNTGSFATLGVVPERPHSFSMGDRPQQAALLAGLGEGPQSFSLGERPQSFGLGERPQSFTLLDASRPNSFTLGHQSPAPFIVERSAASYSGLVERSAHSFSGMDSSGGLAVVERSAPTQRSFTMGQRPQLQQGGAWYESEPSTGAVLQAPGAADGNSAMYQLVANQAQLQEQQQQQGGGRLGLSALWQWR